MKVGALDNVGDIVVGSVVEGSNVGDSEVGLFVRMILTDGSSVVGLSLLGWSDGEFELNTDGSLEVGSAVLSIINSLGWGAVSTERT